MDYVVALGDAHLLEPDGPPRFVARGERWAADDPLVKRHPNAFGPAPSDDIRRSVPVEEATSVPGQKRTRSTT